MSTKKHEDLMHKHVLVKAFVKNPPTRGGELEEWFAELIEIIKMKIVVPPRTYYVLDEHNRGLTGSLNLSTSHAAIHIWDALEPAKVEFDLYSCAEFNEQDILDHMHKYWGLINFELWTIDRNGDFKIVNKIKG